jgi:hypothetical protein
VCLTRETVGEASSGSSRLVRFQIVKQKRKRIYQNKMWDAEQLYRVLQAFANAMGDVKTQATIARNSAAHRG